MAPSVIFFYFSLLKIDVKLRNAKTDPKNQRTALNFGPADGSSYDDQSSKLKLSVLFPCDILSAWLFFHL